MSARGRTNLDRSRRTKSQAIVVRANGAPEVLRLERLALPALSRNEVRVRVSAVGVNFVDIYERSGAYPLNLPFTPGREAAGVVEEVGENVDVVAPGDRVAYATQLGAYAEEAIVPANQVVPVPDDIDLSTAAAVLLQGLTAHYLSHSTYRLEKRSVALVHAAAGGVGHLLVQLAKWRGATVVGTVSTEEKSRLATSAGADHVILYSQRDFLKETMSVTSDRGVDVVYDSVGRNTFRRSLECLRPRGMLVLYGQASGPVEPVDPQVLNRKGSLFLTRPTLRDYVATRRELLARADALFQTIRSGDLQVRIDRTFRLENAAKAHAYLAARRSRGKVLLTP